MFVYIFSSLDGYAKKEISFNNKIKLMIEIAEGVQEFHNMNFCLRTLRPSTILVMSDVGDNFEIGFS